MMFRDDVKAFVEPCRLVRLFLQKKSLFLKNNLSKKIDIKINIINFVVEIKQRTYEI